MQLNVKVDVSEAVARLDELQHRSLPFALAKTVTGCAKAGQVKVQQGLAGKFTLRNNFTLQGIRIKPADKAGAGGTIQADVHTHTDTGSHPDYLLAHEEGAEKVPWGGHHYVSVPTKYLRQMAPGVIPAELKPGALLTAVGGRYTAVTRRKGQIALRNQKRVRGFVFFVQSLADGHKAIMGRYWTDRDAYPFYLLIPEARIKPRLEMERDVETAVQRAFPELWAETWRQIMLKGLRIS